MRKTLLLFAAILVLAACSMPETKIYSLYTPYGQETGNKEAKASMVVTLEAPRYLAQPYIAYRTSPYQLTISKYSKWDAPPSEIVKQAFGDCLYATGAFREVRIASLPPAEFYILRIKLKKFEMSDAPDGPSGELAFDAEFVAPDGTEQYRSSIVKQIRLDDKTFLSLAKSMSSALSEGVEEVKGNVVRKVTASKM